MSPAALFRNRALHGAGALVLVAGSVSALLLFRAWDLRSNSALPPAPPEPPAVMPVASAPPADMPALDWTVFRGRVGAGADAGHALNQRFRLAGTFFQMSTDGQSDVRMAILDDLQAGQQLLVRERDTVEGILVVEIRRDRVRLRDGSGQEVELELTFAGGAARRGAGGEAGAGAGEAGGGAASAAFGGARHGEFRWTFDRAALLRYYQDLRDQPERLVQLFDSLKPEYAADNRITGYRLGVEGEGQFFDAVGLLEGDVVRKVNNVEMTNRRRAEFFVSQFVRDEANAFVLDVERAGVTNRLVYEVR